MKDESSRDTDVIIWFDIFSINQHIPTQWTFDWLSTAFMSAIESFGRTVVVLSPWYAPIPFTRLWCIYEAYSAMYTGGVFEIAMSESDQRQFLEDVRDDPQRRVNQMLGTIRAEKADCFLEEDRENIFSVVQRSVGFGEINSMVFRKYRDWVLKVSIDAYEKSSNDVEKLEILSTIGSLYSGQGKHQQAEAYLKECLEKRKLLLGDTHPDTLKSMDQYAVHCTAVGRYNEGRVLHEECLARRLATFGENHVLNLQSIDNLAFLHQCQGNFESAETLYHDCLARRRTSLGQEHPHTMDTLSNLATLHVVRAKYDLARPLYKDCLRQRKRQFGKTHPGTLTSIHNLAHLSDHQGAIFEAQTLYEVCLTKRQTVMGDGHPATRPPYPLYTI
jgi:tetratricopeptide (TPR) repeat protein